MFAELNSITHFSKTAWCCIHQKKHFNICYQGWQPPGLCNTRL